MYITYVARSVHNAIQGHASQFEKIHFLLVHFRNRMFGVRQTDERNFFICPILLERHHRVRSQREDDSPAVFKIIVLVTQARQLRAAIRSHEAAQERKHNGLPAQTR